MFEARFVGINCVYQLCMKIVSFHRIAVFGYVDICPRELKPFKTFRRAENILATFSWQKTTVLKTEN